MDNILATIAINVLCGLVANVIWFKYENHLKR